MKGKLFTLFFFLVSSSLSAVEVAPWFSPLWEFQGRAFYVYNRNREVDTANGTLDIFGDSHSANFSLTGTIWPYWNVEAEVDFTHNNEVAFSYRSSFFTVRYQWLDDIVGDPISLTSGITAFFPATHFLDDFTYPYHGHLNFEVHGAIGKEFASCTNWESRIWAYGGIGAAERGMPWVHAIIEWEWRVSQCSSMGLFSESLFGLGNRSIVSEKGFKGYSLIDHRNVDIGAYFNRQIGVLGTVSVAAWYTVYAHNFIKNRLGLGFSVLIPFSL